MGDDSDNPRKLIPFHCTVTAGGCGHRWEGEPERVVDAPELEGHPWRYEAACPECGHVSDMAHWARALLKAWPRATGPRTEEGKARSRLNALKHGFHARVARFFPAKPGHYPQCDGCEYFLNGCTTDSAGCLKRAELFLKFQVAVESRDPSLLLQLQGDNQAAIQALINDMIQTIVLDGGPRQKTPAWYSDKDGGFHLARFIDEETGEQQQIYELKQHPLLKTLIEYIQKNSLTLEDMGMTPKVQEEQDLIRGHLENEEREQVLEYQREHRQRLDDFRAMFDRSRQRIGADPILLEHREQEGEDG